MKTPLPPGKIPPALLKQLISALPTTDQDTIIPPTIGIDAGGIKINDRFFAITTDPITISTSQQGMYSVCINANDIACLGCRPRWYSSCLLLPIGTSKIELKHIWKNIIFALKRHNISAIGGHIEVTSAVSQPIIIAQMIGEAIGDRLLSPQDSKAGDQILLWKKISIEGTALLATEYFNVLKQHLPKNKLKKIQKLSHKPGICIWPMVKKLLPCKGVVAIHDVTEGGIANALHDIADASKLGIKINGDKIPILPETKMISKILKFNPLGLIGSGSALIVCHKNSIPTITRKIGKKDTTHIGELTKSKQRLIKLKHKYSKLPRFSSDEIIRIL